VTRPSPAAWGRFARAAAGAALVALCASPVPYTVPVLKTALRWEPLRYGLWAIGVLTVLATIVETVRALRAAGADPGAADAGAAPPRPARLGLAVDLAAVALFGAGGLAAHAAWQRIASPDRVLSGFDYNVYALNALAVSTGEWTLYNPDKHVFHARVVAWMAGDGDFREPMVALSVVCMGLFPVLTYALGRLAGGRFGAVLAALLATAVPLPWHFTAQTTAYPLFFAVSVAAAGAVVWAVQRPGVATAVLAGALWGLAAATQEKALVVLAPVLALAVALAAPAAWRALRAAPVVSSARTVGLSALGGAVALGVLHLSDPPVNYTTFVSLITNQREEMHRELPYAWPEVKTPDLADPAGIRAWLPEALWDGPIESWVAAARTPPDSTSLRLDRDPRVGVNPWTISEDTSIAPVATRLTVNARSALNWVGPLPEVGLVLFGLGAASLLVVGGPRGRVAFALVGAVASGLTPLTLKFYEHYFPHLVPLVAVLAMAGGDRLVRALLPGRWVWGGRALLAGLGLSFALALWTGDADAWRSPSLPFPSPAARARPDPGNYAANLQVVATWLATQDHPADIVDCVPGSMLMVAPRDARFTHENGDGPCRVGLATDTPGEWLVASGHREYRGPSDPDPVELVRSGRWTIVYGWDKQRGALTDAAPFLPTSAVVVLARTELP
jgi:hypothetical protein